MVREIDIHLRGSISDIVAMLMQTNQTRKMIHSLLNLNVANKYVPYQMLENKQMLNDLLDTPDDFLEHIRRYSNALTTSMVFGWRTPTYADAKLQQLFDGFGKFADINQTGVAALVDFFPWLRWLPDWALTMQAYAKELHREERRLYVGHWMKAKEEIKAGTISHCFCVGMAEAQEKEGFSDAQAVSLFSYSQPSQQPDACISRSAARLTSSFVGVHIRRPPRSRVRHDFKHHVRLRASDAAIPRSPTLCAATNRRGGGFFSLADHRRQSATALRAMSRQGDAE
jgi:hypothetical protein